MVTSPPTGTRSMFGEQVSSKRASAPSYGFGSSDRDKQSKIFVSQEHAKLCASSASPGPSAYTLKSAVGSQTDARKSSAPTWGFGSAERFMYDSKRASSPGPGTYRASSGLGPQVRSVQTSHPSYGFGTAERKQFATIFVSEEHNKARHGVDSPGPMVYEAKSGFSKQENSRQKSSPSWGFGSAGRFKYEHPQRASTSPGPGAYRLGPALGAQVSSTKNSAPAPGFGSSNREHQSKAFVSPEHAKLSVGVHSPGPVAYTLGESTGRQTSSKNQSMPSWGFGTDGRFNKPEHKTRAATPGPGAYCV